MGNFESLRKNLKMQFAAATLVAAASGIGSSNGAADANSVRLARPDSPSIVHTNCGVGYDGVSTCWEAYAAFVPAANQTLGEGDLTDSYGTEWDRQNGKGDCGLIINDSSNNMQNATCAISYTPGAIVNFGGSAFVYDANTVAGLDFSSEVSAVFTWDNEIADIDAWVATKDANITDTSIADCFTSGNNQRVHAERQRQLRHQDHDYVHQQHPRNHKWFRNRQLRTIRLCHHERRLLHGHVQHGHGHLCRRVNLLVCPRCQRCPCRSPNLRGRYSIRR